MSCELEGVRCDNLLYFSHFSKFFGDPRGTLGELGNKNREEKKNRGENWGQEQGPSEEEQRGTPHPHSIWVPFLIIRSNYFCYHSSSSIPLLSQTP